MKQHMNVVSKPFAITFSRAISHVSVRLKANVSEITRVPTIIDAANRPRKFYSIYWL
jgi:hypothetical protein